VHGIAVQDGRVFAVGTTCATASCDVVANVDFSVRAYEVADGTLLWEDHFDVAGGDDKAFGVAVAGKQVIVVGHSQDAAGNFDWLVRTYKVADGVLLWQDQFDRDGKNAEALAVTVLGKAVFVGGLTLGLNAS
jgi:hypothetical protein